MMTYLGHGLYRDNEEGRFIVTGDESPEERQERLNRQKKTAQSTQVPQPKTCLQQIQTSMEQLRTNQQPILNGGVNNANFGLRLRKRFNRKRGW